MVEAILIFLSSFLIVMIGTPSLIVISTLKNLTDHPNYRKLHHIGKPRIGGMIVFFALVVSYLFFLPQHFVYNLRVIMVALFIAFAIGLKDDIVGVASDKKLMLNIIISAVLIFGMNFRIHSFSGILGIYELQYWASVAFTCFVVVVIMNSFNLIDGIDGLASSISIVSASFLSFCLLQGGAFEEGYLGVALIGALIGFLIYNISPSKIFLGDSGSLSIGIINTILVIKFLDLKELNSSVFFFEFTPLFAISVLILPLMDVFRVFCIRVFSGKSPFSADRNHIHHNLMDLGFKENNVVILLTSWTVITVGFAVFLKDLNATISILILIFISLIISSLPHLILKKRNRKK